MIEHRGVSSKRRVFKGLLAISIGFSVSIVLPNLKGEPPKATMQKKGDNGNGVQIRFPSASDVSKTQESEAPLIGGKLAADVARNNVGQTAKIDSVASINVATNEEKNQKIATD